MTAPISARVHVLADFDSGCVKTPALFSRLRCNVKSASALVYADVGCAYKTRRNSLNCCRSTVAYQSTGQHERYRRHYHGKDESYGPGNH